MWVLSILEHFQLSNRLSMIVVIIFSFQRFRFWVKVIRIYTITELFRCVFETIISYRIETNRRFSIHLSAYIIKIRTHIRTIVIIVWATRKLWHLFCARNCLNRLRQMVCEVSSANLQLVSHRLIEVSWFLAVLALYLRDSLSFSEESSTSFYHIFNFFSQFCPIFGAILADSYFGNVKTIFYLFFLYALGWIGVVTMTYPFTGLPMAWVHSFQFDGNWSAFSNRVRFL